MFDLNSPFHALALLLCIWLAIGCIRLTQLLGNKFPKERWYDWAMCAPMFVILFVLVHAIDRIQRIWRRLRA